MDEPTLALGTQPDQRHDVGIAGVDHIERAGVVERGIAQGRERNDDVIPARDLVQQTGLANRGFHQLDVGGAGRELVEIEIHGLDGQIPSRGKCGHEVRSDEAARAENSDAGRPRRDLGGQHADAWTGAMPFLGGMVRFHGAVLGMKMSGHRSLPEW